MSGNRIFIILGIAFLAACSPKTTTQKKPHAPTAPDRVKEKPVMDKEPLDKSEVDRERRKIEETKDERIISLLMPFELSSINYKTAGFNQLAKAEIAIDFYQGFKMALDSIAKHSDTNFKLQVYDSKDDPAYVGMLAAKAGVKNSDLIVGPVFPNGMKAFTPYSIAMEKVVVSPLAATGPEAFNNPYLITLNNSIEQHAARAVGFIKQLRPKKVVLIRSGQQEESKYAVPFKKEAAVVLKNTPVAEIGIKAVGLENVFKSLSPVGLNVVVLPSTDRNFLLSITNELEKLSRNFEISVVGHPSWENFEFLNSEKMQLLRTHITSSYQVDFQDYRVNNFIENYRQKFHLEPGEYAFKGFDAGYFLGKLLSENGKDFAVKLDNVSFEGMHGDVHLTKDPKKGYINDKVMVLEYQGYKLERID